MFSKKPKPLRKSTSAFIFNDNGEILLVQLHQYKLNEWNFPGGGLNRKETHYQAIVREVREEVSLKESDLTFLAESKHVNRYLFGPSVPKIWRFSGQEKYQFMFSYSGPQEIKIQRSELRAYAWVPIKELSKYLILPGQIENADKVLEEYRTLLAGL